MIRLWYLVMVALVVGCADGPPPPDAVAVVGGDAIPYQAFEEFLARSEGLSAGALPSEVLSRLFDEFVREELVVRWARDRGLEATQGRGALASVLDELEGSLPEVSDDRVAARFLETRVAYALPERWELAQILVEDEAVAEDAIRRLDGGEPFAAVATELSSDPAADYGGRQPVLSAEDLPRQLAGVIRGLEVGEHSGVVETDYGYAVFLLLDRHPPGQVGLSEVQESIRADLRREDLEAALGEVVVEAVERYDLRVYADHLPFFYRGSYS